VSGDVAGSRDTDTAQALWWEADGSGTICLVAFEDAADAEFVAQNMKANMLQALPTGMKSSGEL
jgi:hypothetical protein